MVKTLKHYFKKAKKEKWAIGQFNFSNLEQLQGIIIAAKNKKSPVIVGTSTKESQFIGLRQAVALVNSFREEMGLPIFLNLDHGKIFSYTKKAIDLGYQAVHFDGSELPLSENIKITKRIVEYAHQRGVVVEGEVGIIGGDLTSSEEVKKFIKEVKTDILTVNIGTSHGIKFSEKNLNLKRLKEISNITGKIPLVLHGGSGVLEKDIKAIIKLGIIKINVNTELRIAYTNALRKVLKENLTENISYKYMPTVISAVQKVVEEKIKLFGSVNKI